EAGEFSLPPAYLLGILVLDPYGFHEYMTYVGLPILLLALLGLRRVNMFWWLAALVAMAFALGTHFVVFPILFKILPGLAFLRVPSRAWFIVALSVAILAAYGVERLSVSISQSSKPQILPYALIAIAVIA